MTDRTTGGITRRDLLAGAAAAAALSAIGRRGASATTTRSAATSLRNLSSADWDAIVVGAGAFRAWTAWHLRRAGRRPAREVH